MLTTTKVQTAPSNHSVHFYSDDVTLAEKVADFVASALTSGNASVVFATKAHRDGLLEALKRRNIDVDGTLRDGSYIQLDAAEVLSAFLVNGWPDRALFFQAFDRLVQSASKAAKAANPKIAVFGEAVALLCEEGRTAAAIWMEHLGNELKKRYNVEIMCAYPMSVFTREREQALRRICAEHSAVYSH